MVQYIFCHFPLFPIHSYDIDKLGFPYFSKILSKISFLCLSLFLSFFFFCTPFISLTVKSLANFLKFFKYHIFEVFFYFLKRNMLFPLSDFQYHISLFLQPSFSFCEIILSLLLDCILFSRERGIRILISVLELSNQQDEMLNVMY